MQLAEILFGVTHFERPEHLARLVASIETRYPCARIVVADNSFTRPPEIEGVERIDLPPDAGLSACRNALVDRLGELGLSYLLLLEDDFLFTPQTRVELLYDVLAHDPEIGFAAGSARLPHDLAKPFYGNDFRPIRRNLHIEPARGMTRQTAAGTRFTYLDLPQNFGLIRRAMLADHRWREELKLGEHEAYFWDVRCAQQWRVAGVFDVAVDHDRMQRTAFYKQHRNRAAELRAGWLEQAGFEARNLVFPARPERIAAPPVRGADKPNVVIMGVGHSGTTILARMLAALGWNLCDADEEFSESVLAREVNNLLHPREPKHPKADDLPTEAWRLLDAEQFPSPWVVKDPRFVWTLDYWLPVFERLPAPPVLVWLTKDTARVAASHKRRGAFHGDDGQIARHVQSSFFAAQKSWAAWPAGWVKVRVDYDAIGHAAGMFAAR